MAEKITNAEKATGSLVVVEGDIRIDPTIVSRSIYVTGFQATTTEPVEFLIIYFQRKKNGGGDIDSIIISKRGAAVITFEDPEGKMFMIDWLPHDIKKESTYNLESFEGIC